MHLHLVHSPARATPLGPGRDETRSRCDGTYATRRGDPRRQCVACPACQANGTMRASLTTLWRPACQAGRSSKHVGRLEPWRRGEPSPALIGESPDVWVISQSVTSRPKRRPRWETMMGAMSPRRIGFGESATAVCRMLSYGPGAPLLASSHPAASLLEINYIHGQSVIQVS